MCSNITNRARSTLQVLQRTKFHAFIIFSVPKIISRNTPETRRPLFTPNKNHKKKQFFNFFPVKFYDGETNFSSQNYFSRAEITYESNGVLFDQMKVSERRTEPKNRNEVISIINKKPRQFHIIKSNKKVIPTTRELYFVNRKPQKLRSAKNCFQNYIQKFHWKFTPFSVSCIVPKKKRKVASYCSNKILGFSFRMG